MKMLFSVGGGGVDGSQPPPTLLDPELPISLSFSSFLPSQPKAADAAVGLTVNNSNSKYKLMTILTPTGMIALNWVSSLFCGTKWSRSTYFASASLL